MSGLVYTAFFAFIIYLYKWVTLTIFYIFKVFFNIFDRNLQFIYSLFVIFVLFLYFLLYFIKFFIEWILTDDINLVIYLFIKLMRLECIREIFIKLLFKLTSFILYDIFIPDLSILCSLSKWSILFSFYILI